jgi:hypothetical protein
MVLEDLNEHRYECWFEQGDTNGVVLLRMIAGMMRKWRDRNGNLMEVPA